MPPLSSRATAAEDAPLGGKRSARSPGLSCCTGVLLFVLKPTWAQDNRPLRRETLV
jgi:hypothetical protein